jgi:SpoVK/Ycf46/Vps4 family AAA+-type ATPase
VQCLAEYARLFAETKIRLVLVTPGEFELPTELQDVITMLDFDPPNRPELIELYRHMINDSLRDPETRPNFNNEEVDRIVAAGSGLTALEFENALGRAIIINRHDLPNVEVEKVFEVILSVKTEAVKRSQVLELMPTVTMDEVGGLDILKEWVRKRRACFTQEFKEFSNNDKVNGIAAIGPPGTGKSLVAKAIGNSLGVPCVRFDVSRVFQSLVGSSEARVRSTLKLVEAMAPCVCLLDEMDKAFDMNSAGGDSGVGKRVLGAILTFMQESRADIFWVLTANRTEGLPSEMLRKGRLDEVFSVTLPTEEERDAILRIHIQKRNQRIPRDLSKAVEASSGYVAAELEAAVREAVMEAYHAGSTVTGELIKAQLQYMKPLSEAFAEQFASMEQWAINNARNASTGARQATVRTRSRSRMAGGKSEGLDLDS